jgi:hypothetical protein
MAKFRLIPYRIRLKRLEDDRDINNLRNIDNHGTDFLTLIQTSLEYFDTARVLNNSMKTISVSQLERDNRDLFGIAEGGEYGISASLTHIRTLERIQNARTPLHSEEYPFLFYFRIPENNDRNFLILEQYKTFGIKTSIQRIINEKINPLGYELKLNHLISRDLLNEIDNSRLLELRLIRYEVPMDSAERVHNGDPREIQEERVFKAKRHKNISLMSSLREYLASERTTAYYEVLDQRYDKIKMVVDRGPDTKTLTFGDTPRCLESMPLDTPSIGGFPEYQSLLRNARIYLTHLDLSFRGLSDVRSD